MINRVDDDSHIFYVTTKCVAGWGVDKSGNAMYDVIPYCCNYRLLKCDSPESARRIIFNKLSKRIAVQPLLSNIRDVAVITFHETDGDIKGEWHVTADSEQFVEAEPKGNARN